MVYIVDFNTCYKIGQTTDLRKRIQAFKNAREKADCVDLIISLENPVDQKSVDNRIELELHKRCKKYKISNELFEKNPEVLRIFEEYKKELGDNSDYTDQISQLTTIRMRDIDNPNINNKKPVFQYDLNGNFIRDYQSRASAERANNMTRGRIKEAISGRVLTSGGFIWSDTPLSEEEIEAKLKELSKRKGFSGGLSIRGKNNTLVQYSLNGEKLNNWNSMTAAGKELGIPVSSISLCCKGVYKTAGGYLWKVEEKVS